MSSGLELPETLPTRMPLPDSKIHCILQRPIRDVFPSDNDGRHAEGNLRRPRSLAQRVRDAYGAAAKIRYR